MGRLRIGIDVDDVLLPTADVVAQIYNRRFGTQLTRDNWYRNTPTSTWAAESEDEIVERVNAILNSEEYVSSIRPVEGALELLEDIRAAGDILFAATSRPPHLAEMTYRALEQCYPGHFSEGMVTFINHSTAKGSVNRITKTQVALEMQATHFIDDFEHHLRPMVSEGVVPLLFGRGYKWNEGLHAPGIYRTHDMAHLMSVLRHERTK